MPLPLRPKLQHGLHARTNRELSPPSTNRRHVIVAKDRWGERTAVDQRTPQEKRERAGNAAVTWTVSLAAFVNRWAWTNISLSLCSGSPRHLPHFLTFVDSGDESV
jgi:hypothetical protein